MSRQGIFRGPLAVAFVVGLAGGVVFVPGAGVLWVWSRTLPLCLPSGEGF